MKYKLKKWYPSLPKNWKVGDTVSLKFSHFLHDSLGVSSRIILDHELKDHPEFWEKVPDNTYKILSFKPNNKCPDLWTEFDTNKWCRNHNGFAATSPYTLAEILQNPRYSIYSVQRLSDGEIFTIGDQVRYVDPSSYKYFIIFDIYITSADRILLRSKGCQICKYLEKVKLIAKPLFKTEDDVNIFEHSVYHSVYLPTFEYVGRHIAEIPNNGKYTNRDTCKTFSTKEKAEEYVLMHKPCLSIKEIAPIFGMYHLDNSKTSLDRLTEKLKDLVKSKQ